MNFTYEIVDENEKANVDFFVDKDAGKLYVNCLKSDISYIPKYGMKESFEDYMNWIKDNSLFWTNTK